MLALIHRNELSLISAKGFDQKLTTGDRSLLVSGTIDGFISDDYTISGAVSSEAVSEQLPLLASRLSGAFAGISMLKDAFEFAISDLSGVRQIYFGVVEEGLVLSDSLFDVATSLEHLEYQVDELEYFIRHGYCRPGKTFLRGICRIPPGKLLLLDSSGDPIITSYLQGFYGAKVNYQVFKNAFQSALQHTVESNPALRNTVLLSGGVDSSLLLAALKLITDVSAVSWSIEPRYYENATDVIRSQLIAKKLDVQLDVIEMDFRDIGFEHMLALPPLMPLSAHLGSAYLLGIETLRNRQMRGWSGMMCDTIYNLGPTGRRDVVGRFLLTKPYLRMLEGVKNHERYRYIKTITDFFIRRFTKWRMGITARTPESLDDLLRFFLDSKVYLALGVDACESTRERTIDAEMRDNVSVKEAWEALFDVKLGGFFTGGESKVLLCSGKLNNVQVALPYSKANLVLLFRNLGLSWSDALLPKRFVYKYAREFGLKDSDFVVKRSLLGPIYDFGEWQKRIIDTTAFGEELKLQANLAEQHLGRRGREANMDTMLGLIWIESTRKLLEQRGATIKAPSF